MTRNSCQGLQNCCFENCGSQLNPLQTKNVVLAGSVCANHVVQEENCLLATAYMPTQVYQAGYCPEEALCQGTMFPELVRPYC